MIPEFLPRKPYPKKWLSNRGYNLMIQSKGKMLREFDDEENFPESRMAEGEVLGPLIKQLLLLERYNTECLLDEHHLLDTFDVAKIPGVDTVVNFTPFPSPRLAKRNWRIAVEGMPRAGKDTLLGKLKDLGIDWIYVSEEPYTQAKDAELLPRRSGIAQQRMLLAGTLGEYIVGETFLKQRGITKGGVNIQNRSLSDNPVFTRSRFLYGDIPFFDYFDPKNSWIFNAHSQPDARFVFIQEPKTTVARKISGVSSGRLLNEDFSEILWQEYVADILRSRQQRQPNLVVFNSEGTIEENFIKFKNLLFTITQLQL